MPALIVPSTVLLPQFQPEIYFPGPETGMSPEDYLQLFLVTGKIRGDVAKIVQTRLVGRTGADAQLKLLDAEATAATLDRASSVNVQRSQQMLLRAVSPSFILPSGESLLSLTVTCLAQPHLGRPTGTVVVVQQTDKTVRYFLLPSIQVNTATGAVIRRPAIQPAPVSTQLDSVGFLDGALQIGSCLAFALEAPWGPVASSGLQFFEMLLGMSSPDPLQVVVQVLENYIEDRDIDRWRENVQNFVSGSNGLETQLTALKITSGDDQKIFLQDLINMIQLAVNPGQSDDNVNGAYVALSGETRNLVQSAAGGTRQQYFDSNVANFEQVLDLTILAASSMLLGMKLQIQLRAKLASIAYVENDHATWNDLTGAWLTTYAVYQVSISDPNNGLVQAMNSLIEDARAARQSLVGPTIYGEFTQDLTYVYGLYFIDAAVENPNYENYNPNVALPTTLAHFVLDTQPENGCCGSPIVNQDQIDAERQQYVAAIDARFDKRLQAVQAWLDSVNEWISHLPPKVPDDLWPSIADNAVWASQSSHPPDWVDGNAVQYAVAFVNALGPSEIGNFSDSYEVGSKAFPTVTVPTDPMHMTTARRIYRRFSNWTDPKRVELVSVISDNTTDSFVDKSNQ